jgi:Tfp pilus assembly PilM family ATPase
MGIPFLSGPSSPILVDFGQASVKCLQLQGGATPTLLAAAELPIPQEERASPWEFLATALPELLRTRGFRGRRVLCSLSSAAMVVQHVQFAASEGASHHEQARLQLSARLGRPAEQFVIRSLGVAEVQRDGQLRQERICFAVRREEVMRIVEGLRRQRYSVVGVHDPFQSLLRAFAHLHRREEDREIRTLYLDLGWGDTKVAIAHGNRLVFAKCVPVGGRHWDLDTAVRGAMPPELAEDLAQLDADFASLRLAMGRRGDAATAVAAPERRLGRAPAALPKAIDGDATANAVASSEAVDTLANELSMCLRYYHSLFPDAPLQRAIFVGGEARRLELCQRIARGLRLPAQLGDPLAGLGGTGRSGLPEGPHPGWAVACGLHTAPADL